MLWKEVACLAIVVLGAAFFLCGANYYDVSVGWTGVGLLVGGIFAYMILRVYESLTRKGDQSESVKL